MIRAALHRLFAIVRLIEIEWRAWSASQNIESSDTPLVEAPVDDGLDAEERAIANDIREYSTSLTDEQIRNAAIGFIAARRKIQARDAKYARAESR